MADAKLLRLAERLGIASEYHDLWGKRHVAAAEDLVALLRQFDVEADGPEAIAQAERRLDAAAAGRTLPPVLTVRAGAEAWPLRLRLPSTHPARTMLRWTLTAEDGSDHPGELALAGAARFDDGSVECQIALALPPGYHRLRMPELDPAAETLVIAAPERCYRPPALQGDGQVWGPSLQLYALRSERNWGIGDFGDLAVVIEQWARLGAGIVGLNPLHALFTHNPAHISPYSPSSRLQLNVLYIDVDAVEDLRDCLPAQALRRSADFQERLARLRDNDEVDYVGVAAAKFEVLRLLHAHFHAHELANDGARARDFRSFCAERGTALRRHASFEALQARFHADDPGIWGWPVWPEAYRDPDGEAVRRFVAEHAEEIEFHEYLQWLADRQLRRLSRRCQALGLAVGLYLDLAVSVDRAGSDTWSHAAIYAVDASVGAPPDDFNPNGQGWGLPPLRPDRLRASGHALFIATLRESMRHAGALRIDHVMALMRLFWIPPGKSPRAGAYVHYPFDELLAIVLVESHRNRCMVIGEDLGTVAEAVREAMARTEMLSYRLLYFERGEDGVFKPPADYPREALVAVSTHDLPTLAGWWSGHDLGLRLALGLLPDRAAHDAQCRQRAEERVRLLQALQRDGLFDGDVDQAARAALTPALLAAVHGDLAHTPARVLMLQLDDVLGVVDQANLPGTTDEHANWRRKLPVALERLHAQPAVGLLAGSLARLRPHAPLAAEALRGPQAVVPRATYRLQFHADFDFDAAIRLLPYLRRLGISHVYGSPITRARPGSRHGYDVVAHHEINPELGGRAGFERFCAALRAHGMGQLLDLVPNHMGVLGGDNAWWLDVLEHGPASAHARWFDIDWQPVNRDLHGKVLLPVLGGHYGEVLERGELKVAFDAGRGSIAVRYFEHRFPLDPRSYPMLLDRAAQALHGDSAASTLQELRALSAAFAELPPRDADDRAMLARRAREQGQWKCRLAELASAPDGVLRHAIEDAAAALGREHDADSADALDALLDAQAWRLAYWRMAADEINYRRFFDINELAALRMEDPAVFEATQGMALDLAAAGLVDGLRIDHPDGLFDPARYFARLQQGHARRAGLPPPLADDKPLYVVVEKIVAAHEEVPRAWPVHGTTGYRFAMLAGGVLIDATAEGRIDRIWRRHADEPRRFDAIAHEAKRDILRSALAAELTALATECRRIARADRASRDHSYNTLREALAEIAACMPVYRTYIDDDGASAQDIRYIDWAVAQARKRSLGMDSSVFEFLHGILLGRASGRAPAAQVLRFARRFQQFCAPVAAKGVEDTAFYRYGRLVALNEVGGDPATFGVSVRAFHGASADRAQHYRHTVLATSTHDNKRSEDVRMRLGVLSELPAQWRLGLRRWRALTARLKTRPDAPALALAPSAADELLLVQTLLGTLPAGGLDEASLEPYRERIAAYMLKAVREAKRHSSWVNPDADYEAALAGFIHAVLGRVQANPVLAELQAQADRLAWFGALASLSLVLLKFTSPGVPDLYQGNELIDLSLVDPDNRRPVDFDLRVRTLDALADLAEQPDLAARLPAALLATPHDGRAKLWCTWRLLQLRARLPELFREGSYTALASRGRHAEHVLAYARSHAGRTVVVVAGRLFAKLMRSAGAPPLGEAVWADTEIELPMLADGTRLDDALSGATLVVQRGAVRVSCCFAGLPGAALVARDDPRA